MKGKWKGFNKEKGLFKTVYCLDCKQVKTCGKLNSEYCCSCYYQSEQQRAEEYSNYQQVYQKKEQERQARIQQLQLLRSYPGCNNCGSKEVDGYSLYEDSQLFCQPCRIAKEGGASGAISFLGQQKWYKRFWKIELTEWLENFSQLPINNNCAKEWVKDKNHLNNCRCLEKEVKNLVNLFINSSKECRERLKKCSCKTSEKVRIDYLDSAGSGWTYCEKCETRIESAGHHGVIKNRHSPSFWGLNVKEKVLCGNCLENKKESMPSPRRAEFNRYRKVGRL